MRHLAAETVPAHDCQHTHAQLKTGVDGSGERDESERVKVLHNVYFLVVVSLEILP